MLAKRALTSVVAALLLNACASATPTTTPRPAENEAGTPAAVLNQARDVAGQLDQREAQLESIAP
jgi:outer membrane PBP1 activator LpoA protein